MSDIEQGGGIEQGIELELSPSQVAAREGFRRFVTEHVAPHAGDWDRRGEVPQETIERLRDAGHLGSPLPTEDGGRGLDAVTYGLLTEEIGRGCSSLRSLLTVHDMVSLAAKRWGSDALRDEVLPAMARGERRGALALSEPNVGSDAAAVETAARRDGDDYILNGHKKWTTFGQTADELLVLAHLGDEVGETLTAFLVPADAEGVERRPLPGMVGTRASLLAEIELDEVRVPGSRRVGREGFGLSHVIGTALDHGRYSVAWGSVGIAQACLDACLDYTAERIQGDGKPIAEHQLIQRRLTEMIASTRAARLLCYRAGYLRSTRDPGAVPETMIAKYFASRTAVDAANAAVHIHGANGLSESYPIERYLRDSKVTEIIEGSTEIQQISIPRYPLAEL